MTVHPPESADAARALVNDLLTDCSLLRADAPTPGEVLPAWRRQRDEAPGELLAALVVPASLVPAALGVVDPADDVPVVVASVGPGAGLAELVSAVDVLLDQPWLRPVGAWLDVVPVDLPTAVGLTLDALDLTVTTALFLPGGASWDELQPALDVLAEDGAEQVGWHLRPGAEGAREAATFLVACQARRLTTVLTAPQERLAGLLTAALVASDGGGVTDVVAALRTERVPEVQPGAVRPARRLLSLVGVPDLRAAIDVLLADLGEP